MKLKEGEQNFKNREPGVFTEGLVSQIVNHPRRTVAVYIGVMALLLVGAKVETDRREAECLPLSACHQRMWEEANPGQLYPPSRRVINPFPSGI